MQLTVTGRHIDITEPVKLYAGQKLRHLVDKYKHARITKAHIIMDVQRYQQIVEMELHGPQANIYSKVGSSDMYTSIDKAINKIERQLIRLKTKFKRGRQAKRATIRIPKGQA